MTRLQLERKYQPFVYHWRSSSYLIIRWHGPYPVSLGIVRPYVAYEKQLFADACKPWNVCIFEWFVVYENFVLGYVSQSLNFWIELGRIKQMPFEI